VSSSEPNPSETSRILLKKAEEDATAVRGFAGNQEIADSIIGFHAQQAVEKWLKAVTAANGTRHSTIHDIDRLVEILETAGIEMPLDRDRLAVLTQYAVRCVTTNFSIRSRSSARCSSPWSTKLRSGWRSSSVRLATSCSS
jgi:HEPN domain